MTATSDTIGESQPTGDQSRESQLEAVKDNPPRAPKTQRSSSFTLNCRAGAGTGRSSALPMQARAALPVRPPRHCARVWAKAIARRRSDRARSSRADRRKGAECVERPERFRSGCHASSIAVNRQRSERLQPTAASRMAEAQSAIPWWAEPSSMFSLTVAPKDSAPWDPGKRHGFTTGELDDCVDERLWQRSSQRLRRDSG